MNNKEKSGFVTIDRPQDIHYRKKPIREFDTNQTLYELVYNANKHAMDNNSLGYMGKLFTYGEFIDEVDKAAQAFSASGVKTGDVVAMALINTPEAAVNFLALNKIGAISKWLDLRASPKDLEHYLTEHDCKHVVSLDLLAPKLSEVIPHTDVSKILLVSAADSLPPVKKIAYKLQNLIKGKTVKLPNEKNYAWFKDFVNEGRDLSNVSSVIFDKDRPSVIVQSSGTTGKAKSIIHSDYSFTSLVNQVAYSDLPLYENKSILVVVPPWVAYGLANSLFVALSYSMKAEMVPKFDPDVVFKGLGNFNMCFAAPFHYRYLADNISKIKKEDLEKIDCLISGGDKITIDELEYIKEKLGVSIINGYGNNEGLGAVTFNPLNANKFGTVGVAKPGDEVMIYDNEKETELSYGEVGEVCYRSNTMFIEYSNDEEETKRIKKLHADGNYWIHTGDLGQMDEGGYVSIVGRYQRVIVRQGFKLAASSIENVLDKHPAVKECLAVSVPDCDEENVPMLFYTIKKDNNLTTDQIEAELKEICVNELKENSIPKYFAFIEAMPYTDNNKYDFRKLEELGAQYVESQEAKRLVLRK